MSKKLYFIIITICLVFDIVPFKGILILTKTVNAQSNEVYVGIRDRGVSKIRIAILPFQPEGVEWSNEIQEAQSTLANTISDDLDFSLFFDILDTAYFPQNYIKKKEDIAFFDWSQLGVNALLIGNFKLNDEVEVETRLFSITAAKLVREEKYKAEKSQIRRLAHRISDDMIKFLTGEDGICQTQIAFISTRTGHKEIFISDYDGYGTRQLTSNNSISLYPDWGPDGFNLTYTSYKSGNPDLFMIDWTNNEEIVLSSFMGLNSTAAWSPDGKKVAYTLTKDGNSELYILDTRSGRLTRLTYNYGIDCSPSWSPTGDKIAFTSDRSGNPQVYVIDAVGTNLKRLTYMGNYNDLASWRPGKGDLIAYCSRLRGQFDVCTMDITGENPTCLTSIGNNERPEWSPDGYHIVFASDRGGTYQLYTMDWTGDNVKQVTFGYQAHNMDPTWSPRMRWKFK
ncbi:Tol-Pal system beta propeller repeat protein TolB [bacterium]|nr:Tol-Pal system beta propeller repeat protein TolB [bacterium]